MLLQRYVDAHERADVGAVAELLREDALPAMPPEPKFYEGREAIAAFFARDAFGPASPGRFRLVPTGANRQPAAACYVRRPGDTEYRALSLDVLGVEGDKVVAITAFTADCSRRSASRRRSDRRPPQDRLLPRRRGSAP